MFVRSAAKMITEKKAVALAVGLLIGASYISAIYSPKVHTVYDVAKLPEVISSPKEREEATELLVNIYDVKKLPEAINSLRKWEGPAELSVKSCRLETLSTYLGGELPSSINKLCLDLSAMPSAIPTQEEKDAIVRCTGVDMLQLLGRYESKSSPIIIAWIKLLFPDARKLNLCVDALPIQDEALLEESLLQDLKMENLKELVLHGGNLGAVNPCPIYENLKLFPGVTILTIDYIPTVAALEDGRLEGLRLSHLEKLKLCYERTPLSEAFLNGLATMAPSLKELSITATTLEHLTNSLQGANTFFLSTITKLTIDHKYPHWPYSIILGKNMAEVFPSLSEIEIIGNPHARILFAIESCKRMPGITSLILNGGGTLYPDPDVLKWMFPNLKTPVPRPEIPSGANPLLS